MASRPPLILLPGLVNDERVYAQVRSWLVDASVPVVADLTRGDTMQALAEDVLAKAPDRFLLAGLSMGGYCALEIVHRAPDRVQGLALIDTSARPDTAESRANREKQIARARGGEYEALIEELLPKWVHPSRVDDGAVGDVVRSMARDLGPVTFERQQRAIMSREDSRPRLGAIRCPAIVIHGGDDALMPREIPEETANGIPGAKLVVVPGSGHLSPLERPAEVVAALVELLQMVR
ncbi:MAG TPA: alpha/beta hydrolase [Casimicrobiaceae bacterium]|nr:alpha/beta hydrolase [Casimicrobiaceae bacterium]